MGVARRGGQSYPRGLSAVIWQNPGDAHSTEGWPCPPARGSRLCGQEVATLLNDPIELLARVTPEMPSPGVS